MDIQLNNELNDNNNEIDLQKQKEKEEKIIQMKLLEEQLRTLKDEIETN